MGKRGLVKPKDINLPDYLALRNHRNTHTRQHAHADVVQHFFHLKRALTVTFDIVGQVCHPVLDISEKRLRQALMHGNLPALIFVQQSDKARLATQHFHGNAQNAGEQNRQI